MTKRKSATPPEQRPARLDALRTALEAPSAPLTRKLTKAEGNTNALTLTDAGTEYLGVLGRVGCNVTTAAERIGVSEKWLRLQIRDNEEVGRVWHQNKAADKLDLLLARKVLEQTNAQVHIHSSRTKLGELDQPQAEVAHRHYVVGTYPDPKTYTTENWLRDFSPRWSEEDEARYLAEKDIERALPRKPQ